MQSIDDNVESILKEENASAEAIKSLINVKKREAGEESEVELKTDLTDDEIKIHTVLSVLSNVIEAKSDLFTSKCILSDVIEKKERKALSKDRKSRGEIVAVARQPDMNMNSWGFGMGQNENFAKRFFMGRKEQIR